MKIIILGIFAGALVGGTLGWFFPPNNQTSTIIQQEQQTLPLGEQK